MDVTIDLKQAKREIFKVRSRFQKLQRTVVGQALEFASVPIVVAAKAAAPLDTGRLRERIQFVPWRNIRSKPTVNVGPVKFRKNEKAFPFWGLFQEKGWRAMGRANRKTFKRYTRMPGKHFLRKAGEQNFNRAQDIFAERVFNGLAEIQQAGETAGII